MSTTSVTSPSSSEDQLQVTLQSVKRLLIWAYENYDASFKAASVIEQRYWDGYIRALHHVLELEDE